MQPTAVFRNQSCGSGITVDFSLCPPFWVFDVDHSRVCTQETPLAGCAAGFAFVALYFVRISVFCVASTAHGGPNDVCPVPPMTHFDQRGKAVLCDIFEK